MKAYLKIIKANFLEYISGQTFFITLAATVFVAISFVPSPDAGYTTMRFGAYTGEYDVYWVGLVGAIMASIFLSFFGFFLVVGSIKKDILSKVGQIIAVTKISNFGYLLLKAISNFLVMLTVLSIVIITTILVFFAYGESSDFNLLALLKPYLFIVVPTIFFITILALIFEILFSKRIFLQYISFCCLFFLMLFDTSSSKNPVFLDFFGIKSSTELMHSQVLSKTTDTNTTLSLGFIAGKRDNSKILKFEGLNFTVGFILKRFYWASSLLLLLYICSFLFHRFSFNSRKNDKSSLIAIEKESAKFRLGGIMTNSKPSFRLMPLVISESLMLLRQNEKWISGFTLIGVVATCFAALHIAHSYILPLLWLLQATNLSELILRDKENRVVFLTSTSVKPIKRAFTAKIIAGMILPFMVAIPLLLRCLWQGEIYRAVGILIGVVFIVLLSVLLGLITKTKKTFEITFLLLTYCNFNLLKGLDYFGAHNSSLSYILIMLLLILVVISTSYLLKQFQRG